MAGQWKCQNCGKLHPTERDAQHCKCKDQAYSGGQHKCPHCGRLYGSYTAAQACCDR